ncbi:GGDEF domain-containing protein [Mycobacterium asiaticum]|uniref:Diguanylate cyclase n=1 Tax=Mycobacterium asiaticum TaxID=1790 RepID=A0A1A3CNZ8_MYCAS|nr:GGDEF domain-containing protein [Mycobacterium asiaticum]OBI88498.1 diguanylate cyclase [Mycobacterium asiaticum]
MPRPVDPQPSTGRWHAIGLIGLLILVVLYGAAGVHAASVAGSGVDVRMYWILGGATLLAGVVAVVGRTIGWQNKRVLLLGWPIASLVLTIVVGSVDSDATRQLPGTITITFVYIGLTCPRWRSLVLAPLGVVAFVVGAGPHPGGLPPTAVTAALMWVIVAEVPAWLIAQLTRQTELAHQIAQTDALTQLLDRSTLGHHLSLHTGASTIVLIDLDNFKQYNDTHGHAAGDELLVTFADALRWSVRQDDVVFRIGGDEFLLMLLGADHSAAEQVVARLRQRWTEVGGQVGFSAGIAAGEPDPLRAADRNMYAVKRATGAA